MNKSDRLSVPVVLDALRRRGARGSAIVGLRYLSRWLATNEGSAFEFRWDEYLAWLIQCVPGMFEKGNATAMAYALQHLPDKTSAIVEIGSFCGLSTCVLGYLREKYGVANPLFNCDRWQFEGQELGKLVGDSRHVTHDVYAAFVRASYVRNVETFYPGEPPRTIEAFSDEFFQQWKESKETTDFFGKPARLGGPLGFCYIDGNHTYDFARRDFENADRFLVPGGFILFDDSADGTEWEVRRVVAEVLESGKYRLAGKIPNYLVQKIG